MNEIQLDFRQALPLKQSGVATRLPLSGLLVILALALLSGPLVLFAIQLRASSELEAMHRSTADQYLAERSVSPLPAEKLKEVNEAIRRLNVPWRDLFAAIEANSDNNVALLDVEPFASGNVVHVTAECGRPEDMIEYLNGFMRNGYFASVELKRHQVQAHDGLQTIRFWFDLDWPTEHQLGASP